MTVDMAIQFARMEYVSRGGNGNICLKAAYNKRDQIENNRTGAKYSFETRGGNVHHAILLPEGASDKFLESSVLWNEVELFENRKNSRLAKEIVLALPDDKEISLEDRIELSRRFASENFTSKGLAVQIDIHEPHHDEDKNWHAHLLITTRRFSEDGQTFDVKKARDLDGIIRKGMVLEIDRWGEIWKQVQNSYFEEKGYTLRVDEIGVVAQEHLGPVRMRHHMSEVIARGDLLKVANTESSLDAGKILGHLTEKLSVFSDVHIEGYLNKHVRVDLREKVLGKILGHGELVHLHDKETGELTGFYTTKVVWAEEEKILRVAERVEVGKGVKVGKSSPQDYRFSDEQKKAFEYCLESGHGIRVVQGRAGTGKSYLMQGIKDAYETAGISVVGLAPTRTVVRDMIDGGFEEAKTIHEFLFRYKNGRVSMNQKSVLMVDEAGMVGTRAFGELLKVVQVHGSKVILVGDDRQLPSVERGGLLKVLSEKFGCVELKEVRRQEIQWQRQVSEDLSQGKIREALNLLEEQGAINWHEDKAGSLSALVEDYSRAYMANSSKTRLILSHRNIEVDVLNQAIRQVRQAVGQVSTTEYVCSTLRGDVPFGMGDRVQFMRTDKKLGLSNGEFGVLVEASKDRFKIQKDTGQHVAFDPSHYEGLRLGYASTIYKGQGKTVEEAYVLHSPLMTQNLSYVALTRQVKEVHLYVSREEAKAQEDLVAQMSKSDARVVSLGFLTAQQMEKEQKIQESFVHKMAYGVGDSVRGVLQRFTDHLPNQSFYQVSALPKFKGKDVREQNALEKWDAEKTPPSSDKKDYTQPTGKESQDVLESKGRERRPSKADTAAKAASSPTRVDAQEEKSLNSSTQISSQKTPKTPDRQVEARSLFSYMQESYKRELTEMYQEKVGDKHKLYEKQIDQVATRVAENALIRNIPEDPGLRKVNLSQANYELQRLSEIQEALIEQDPKFFFNWMEHHLKAEVLTAIEGRFYGILRCQKPLLDKQDKKLVQEEAPKHLKKHETKVKKYSREAMKDYDFSKTQAQMLAQQKALFEERFRIKPNEMQEQVLKTAAEYGHSQYEKHKAHIEAQQTNKHGQLSEKALHYIDQAAHYRAHLETKEILMKELRKPGSIFKDERQLAKIEAKTEKEFRSEKDHYDAADKQQQEKQLEQKQTQIQKQADRNRDMFL
jgi:hypothetical protein